MEELEENMLFAHRDRGRRALADLEAVANAPALFKPEFAERASREFDAARAGADLWSS